MIKNHSESIFGQTPVDPAVIYAWAAESALFIDYGSYGYKIRLDSDDTEFVFVPSEERPAQESLIYMNGMLPYTFIPSLGATAWIVPITEQRVIAVAKTVPVAAVMSEELLYDEPAVFPDFVNTLSD